MEPANPSVAKQLRFALRYYRSSSTSAIAALSRYIRYLTDLMARSLRIGLGDNLRLLKAEAMCAQKGLALTASNTKDGPPWSLADDFLHLKAEHLPPHPLIEWEHLTSAPDTAKPTELDVMSTLSLLLSSSPHPTCWQGVPILDDEHPIDSGARVAVCLHLFYPDLWPILRQYLANIPEAWDLYISVPDFACTTALARISQEHQNCRVLPCENRGRDVLPFLELLKRGVFDDYDAVCKLHSKRSPHMANGETWRQQILDGLLGEKRMVETIISRFRDYPDLGMIGPRELLQEVTHRDASDYNYKMIEQLASRLDLSDMDLDHAFFAGTMFWFRPSALDTLRNSDLSREDFPLEMGQTDGTTAHALERLLCAEILSAGYTGEDHMGNQIQPISQ